MQEGDLFLGYLGDKMNVGGNLEFNRVENDPYVFDSARYRQAMTAAAK